jgi:pimeloyl-ACP methyl ester carboxylesterase
MSANIFALLIGIDTYHFPIPQLHGCKNDIEAIHAYLLEREQTSKAFKLEVLKLEDQNATRQAVIDGFRNHLSQAGKDDVVLFYYSGHGSQEPTAPEFYALEPDRLDETLVLVDSRDPDKYDLADKELAKLIKEVADKAGHVAVILDCCHSGSGTRAIEEDGIALRRAPTDERQRPASSYLFNQSDLEPQQNEREISESGWSGLHGKHVLLAACRSSETAKETKRDGQARGAFSAALMAALRQIGANVSYRDLVKRASAQVQNLVQQQTPQLEVIQKAEAMGLFLNGTVPAKEPYFTLSHDSNLGWLIDGGGVHGVQMRSKTETTTLAVFGLETPTKDWEDLRLSLGTLEVTQVLPGFSKVSVKGFVPDETLTYRAIITAQPSAALGVWIGEQEWLREAILNTRGANQPSLFVREVDSESEATFKVVTEENKFRISRAGSERRLGMLVTDVEGLNENGAKQTLAQLEHMARWQITSTLENPGSRLAKAIELKVLIVTGSPTSNDPKSLPTEPAPDTTELRLEQKGSVPDLPEYQIFLKNTSQEELYCALLYLDESYSVTSRLLQGVWLKPGEEVGAMDGGMPISSQVQDDWYEAGITEVHDHIKLIVATDKFDATLYDQDALEVKAIPEGNKKALSRRMGNSLRFADWSTQDLLLTTVRPLEGQTIPKAGDSVSLGSSVTMKGHPALRGQVRLTSVPQVARDLQNRTVPPLLASDPEAWQPWSFTTSRGGDPGLGALELNGVQNAEMVTPQTPLELRVAGASFGKGESVLASAWDEDSQLFLPLGFGVQDENGINLKLERLPKAISERSLVGAIRILFQKFVAQKIGLEFPYPLLRAVTVGQDGQVSYSRPDEVQAKVATANRILLFVHGIIGDTEGMVRCINSEFFKPTQPYDLVLTFDYESINDGILKNATDLKMALEKAGLAADHGKHLDVVVHSMGGLVSRYFIELLGGNKVINKLVMLGTPNAGSPWATVQTLVTTAVGVGMNMLGTVALPIRVLAGLIGLIEKVDQNLDEMQPDSSILKALEATVDPGVPYVLIAGDVLLDAQKQPFLERLLKKLGTEALFLSQANDIASSVSSVMNVESNRAPIPKKIEPIACDHLSYFRSEVGVSALANALE